MTLSRVVIAVVAALATGAHAQPANAPDPAAHHPAPAAATALPSEGEVRRIDLEQGKVTLRHGPIASLDMPAMTMVFRAADPKMLQGLREGDKVRFAADRVGGAITLTALERTP